MEFDSPRRNPSAKLVGWLIVAVVVYLLLGGFVGALFWFARFAVVTVVAASIGGLIWLYLRLRRPPPSGRTQHE